MCIEKMNEIKSYLESGDALKKKYEELRSGVVIRRGLFEEQYKPLLEPLRGIQTELKKPKSVKKQFSDVDEKLKILGPLAKRYLGYYASKTVGTDLTFGIYRGKDGGLHIGNSPIVVENDNIIFPDGERYEGTPGLWELLTLKDPNNYTKDDIAKYEEILLRTYAYRHGNDPNNPKVKSSGGNKYNKIIKPLLGNNAMFKNMDVPTDFQTPPRPTRKTTKPVSLADEMEDLINLETPKKVSGEGLRKFLTNTPVEYVYWNSLTELLERLCIIYGEIRAGNTSPNVYNELVNILQEIKEI